ncbi:helix-turn-helix transcriptional regulator [Thalassospira indica]|uniref:AlpA family phage regulatory protein n=1 Tax=Thalassospira indica TaxID=1891279 RepID=A0ABM6XVD5_9PROT|nr:AlpA family phage regulatory protein [Thalassospira indica]OAZ14827.1 AlpA family transcriptional regulator [Thalassospira profundimaris]
MAHVFVSDKQIASRYSVARSTIWRWVKTRDFPNPIKLASGCSRWRIADVEAWENNKIGGAA